MFLTIFGAVFMSSIMWMVLCLIAIYALYCTKKGQKLLYKLVKKITKITSEIEDEDED